MTITKYNLEVFGEVIEYQGLRKSTSGNIVFVNNLIKYLKDNEKNIPSVYIEHILKELGHE